jgi:SAM-dependent methyltransferase
MDEANREVPPGYTPKSLNKSLGSSYGLSAQNPDTDWAAMSEHEHQRLAVAYAELLSQEGILPTPDKANGFTFFSPSANQGSYEYAFAKTVEDSLTDASEKKPLFIAADMFGTGDRENFVPGFRNNELRPEDFKHVVFQKVSAEAERIPLPEASVDVVWDRLGALWHTQSKRISLNISSDQEVQDLLEGYKRVLKPTGCVIIDSAKFTRGADSSTMEYLQGSTKTPGSPPKYPVDLEKLGWDVSEIGSGETQLTILKPKVVK